MKKYILHMVVAVAGLAAVAAPQADAKVVVQVVAPVVVEHDHCVPPPPPPPRHRLVKPRCPHCRVVYERGVPHLVCVHCCPAPHHHHHHHHAKPKKHKPAPPHHHHHGHAPKRHRH